MAKANTFILLDLETTGLTPQTGDHLIEIAAKKIVLKPRPRVVGEFQCLVNPGPDYFDGNDWKPKFQRAAEIHKYTPKEITGTGLEVDEARYQFTDWALEGEGKTKPKIMTDNAYFDSNFLIENFGRDWFYANFHHNPFDVKLLFYFGNAVNRYSKGKTHKAMDDVNAMFEGICKVYEELSPELI